MLIDDEQLSVTVRAELLTLVGHDVLAAHTGVDGVNLFERYRVACTVLDLCLPDFEGESVLRRIQAIQAGTRECLYILWRIDVPEYVLNEADLIW